MNGLWPMLILCYLFVLDVQGCQQPLLPVYNATGKRYLTCNSWEPDCPDNSVCQRATADWKERLYTNPEFVLYLCCNKDGHVKLVESTLTTTSPVFTPTSFPPIPMPTLPSVDIVPDPIVVMPSSPPIVEAKKNDIMFENPLHQKSNHISPHPQPLSPRLGTHQPASSNYHAAPATQFQQLTQVQPDAKPQPQPHPHPQSHQSLPTHLPQSHVSPAAPLQPNPIPSVEQPTQLPSHVHVPYVSQPVASVAQPSPTAAQAPLQLPSPQHAFESAHQQTQSQPDQQHSLSQIHVPALPPHLRIFSQQLEAHIASAILATRQPQNGQQQSPPPPSTQSAPTPEVEQQTQTTNAVVPVPASAVNNGLSITQSQPPLPLPMGTQTKPGVMPSAPSGKLAALAPQPQVLAAGNGNRVVLGPNICLLVLGEFTQPDKDLVFRYRGTVALIQDAGLNILVDSGSANSKNKLIAALAQQGLRPQNIQVVIYTHAHPDHLGNDNLFPYAQKFFAGSVYKGDEFLPLQQLEEPSMRLTQHVEIWKTPGHTMQHNSILVRNVSSEYVNGTVAVSGDLFLNERDFDNLEQWTSIAVDKDVQKQLRYVLLCQADYIVPGHGKPFAVTASMRSQANCSARKMLAYRYALSRKTKKSRRKNGASSSSSQLVNFHHD